MSSGLFHFGLKHLLLSSLSSSESFYLRNLIHSLCRKKSACLDSTWIPGFRTAYYLRIDTCGERENKETINMQTFNIPISYFSLSSHQPNGSALSWLDSSVGRALHQHHRGHGFKSRSSLKLFRLSFCNCISCVNNCAWLAIQLVEAGARKTKKLFIQHQMPQVWNKSNQKQQEQQKIEFSTRFVHMTLPKQAKETNTKLR